MHMLPFAGWWKSLAAAVMGPGPGKELQLGAVQACEVLGLQRSLAGS